MKKKKASGSRQEIQFSRRIRSKYLFVSRRVIQVPDGFGGFKHVLSSPGETAKRFTATTGEVLYYPFKLSNRGNINVNT